VETGGIDMQIAGVSASPLSGADYSDDPVQLAVAIAVQKQALEQTEQAALQLIETVQQPAEVRSADSRVGQHIDFYI
jgi:hypothetical protein